MRLPGTRHAAARPSRPRRAAGRRPALGEGRVGPPGLAVVRDPRCLLGAVPVVARAPRPPAGAVETLAELLPSFDSLRPVRVRGGQRRRLRVGGGVAARLFDLDAITFVPAGMAPRAGWPPSEAEGPTLVAIDGGYDDAARRRRPRSATTTSCCPTARGRASTTSPVGSPTATPPCSRRSATRWRPPAATAARPRVVPLGTGALAPRPPRCRCGPKPRPTAFASSASSLRPRRASASRCSPDDGPRCPIPLRR